MRKEQIYIGLYSDDSESVFLRKNRNQYYDLSAKRKVIPEEIQFDSFVPYINVINPPRICIRGNVLRLYDLDRCKMVSLEKVFIGNLYQVTEILWKQSFGDSLWNLGIFSKFCYRIVKRDVLLYKKQNEFKFMNIETGELYHDSNISIRTALQTTAVEAGDFFVNDDKEEDCALFTSILDIHETEMEKGKILEKYRDWKRNK